MREKCGEALKIVTVVLASVAQAGGALERAAEEEKDLAYDKTLFQNLLQDLKTAKSTESVKVLGVTMCILGEIHRQHAAVIGAWVREYEWKGKMQSENLQEQFLEYLKNKLNYFDGDKKESGELVSGYLEAVRGSLTGSSQKAADHGGFLQTVYRKVAKILRDSENMHRYKVVEAALDLLKEHAGHFREFFLSDSKEESPATIYDVLLRLCVHVNKEVKTSALVCVLPRPVCLSPVSVRDARRPKVCCAHLGRHCCAGSNRRVVGPGRVYAECTRSTPQKSVEHLREEAPGRENASAVHRAARNRSSGKGKGKNIYRQILEVAPAANKQDAGAD